MIPFGFGYPYMLVALAGLLAVHVLLGIRPALVSASPPGRASSSRG